MLILEVFDDSTSTFITFSSGSSVDRRGLSPKKDRKKERKISDVMRLLEAFSTEHRVELARHGCWS